MLPKVATNLWHFSAARLAAATQQTVVTPTLRTVLQQQSQAAQATAQQATTSVGWNAAGANAAGATSGASSNAASAKFNAGGRFYNAYQQSAQDPSFAATQQDDDERKKNANKRLSKRSVRSLALASRRHAPAGPSSRPSSSLIVSSPAARLAQAQQARLLQTQAYRRDQREQEERERRRTSEESPKASSQNAVILSPKRRFQQQYQQQRGYTTASSDAAVGPTPAPRKPEPATPIAEEDLASSVGSSAGTNVGEGEDAIASWAQVVAEEADSTVVDAAVLGGESAVQGEAAEAADAERLLLSENTTPVVDADADAVVEEVDDAFPELLSFGEEDVQDYPTMSLSSSVDAQPVVVDATTTTTAPSSSLQPPSSSSPSGPQDPPASWILTLPLQIQKRHPALHSIIYLTRTRPFSSPNMSSLAGPINNPPTAAKSDLGAIKQRSKLHQENKRYKKRLAACVDQLRNDGVKDSLTWSYALWSSIMLRAPGEPLKDAIALYNDLLSGTFIRSKRAQPSNNKNLVNEEGERRSWKEIEEEYEKVAAPAVIVPTEEVVALLIRALAVRDAEVVSALQNLGMLHSLYAPLRYRDGGSGPGSLRSGTGTTPMASEPNSRDAQEHRTALEKENNFAPAMALVNATLQNRYPTKLGIVTYNLLLQSALDHARLQAARGQAQGAGVEEGVEVGGVPSAITVFAHLEKSGCRPSGRTFMLLLQIYGVAGDLEGAKEVWNEFRSACARGSIDWVLKDDPIPSPTRKETKTIRPTKTPWSSKAGPVGPDEPLSPGAVRSMISVWSTMLQTYFTCGDAAGGLSLLEKMMDAPWRPLATSRTGQPLENEQDVPEAILTPVDVPPPAANTYFGVVKGFLDAGDIASAIPWFKRLLEQDATDMDTLGRQRANWMMHHGGAKWAPIAHPPRPNVQLWDWMCQALYESGMVWELNDLMDHANRLVHQQTDAAVEAATKKMDPERMKAMSEEERNQWLLKVIHQTVSKYDKREHLHWTLVWRTNVTAMENPNTSPEDKAALLDWLRTRVVDRVFFEPDVSSWTITAKAADNITMPMRNGLRHIFAQGGLGVRDRAWHAVGLYIAQGRIDQGIFLASKLFDLERTHILAAERESVSAEKNANAKRTREKDTGAGDKTLHALADLRSLVAGLDERIWTYGSETKQYPSLEGLVAQLRLNSVAGVMPAMRSAWYSVNAFLAHRDSPELRTIFSENADWTSLAQVFANTAMSVFYEENRPAPNPEMAWQLVTLLQIMHANGKGFADIGRHNVYRVYKILEYHLPKEEFSKLLLSLGERFDNPEQHFPAYVKKSGVHAVAPAEKTNPTKILDVQASVDEARMRYGQASSIAGTAPSQTTPNGAEENRAIPLRITPAQSTYVEEATPRRTLQYNEPGVSPLVGYERLVAGFRVGDVPAPENIARLIVSLSHYKEKEKIIKCYEIGNEVLASLAVNKSWQASGWFALEDAMVTALAHCGDMKAASIHRSRMVAQGSAPSASSYGALIANIKDTTDNAAVAIELFEESRRLNVEPSAYLYNTIISRLAKARKADYAMMLFQAMKTAGLTPTEVTYGAIIAGCARIGDAHTAEVLFEEMRALPGYQARIPPYNTMMQLYTHVKPNRERALKYYNLMEQVGVQPTPYTYKLLLDVYGKVQPVDIEQMEGVIETMKARGVELSGNHYSSVIIARGCAMYDLEGALKIFDSLRTNKRQVSSSLWPMGRMMRGPTAPRTSLPDVLAYEALLTVLVTHHRIDLMQEYFDKMIKQDRVRPTAYINNLLIKGWASAGDLNAAREVFESMLDPAAGAAAPNNHAPHVGINGAQMVNGSIIGHPQDPVYREPSSWEAMIRAELSTGDRDRANALLERMKSRFYPAAVTAKIEGILWAPDIPASVMGAPDI